MRESTNESVNERVRVSVKACLSTHSDTSARASNDSCSSPHPVAALAAYSPQSQREMSYCKGCRVSFRPGGLHSHLRQTRNPVCVAEWEHLHSFLPSLLDDLSASPSEDSEDSDEAEPSEDESDHAMDVGSNPRPIDHFGLYDPSEDVVEGRIVIELDNGDLAALDDPLIPPPIPESEEDLEDGPDLYRCVAIHDRCTIFEFTFMFFVALQMILGSLRRLRTLRSMSSRLMPPCQMLHSLMSLTQTSVERL